MTKKIFYFPIALGAVFAIGGCSYFTVNAAMCDKIASDPHATVPQECRNYSEKEAEKAFNKTKNAKEQRDEEIIKFQKQQDE